jgi:hypothetical protein
MTNRSNLLLMTPALLLLACGDLKSPGGKVSGATYTKDNAVAAFLSRELVTLDGDLQVEQARIPYVGPPDGADIRAQALSADGHVAAIVWAAGPTTIPNNVDVFTVPERQLLASLTDVSQPVGVRLDATGALLAFVSVAVGSTNLEVYDTASGAKLWSFDTTNGYDPEFSPDGAEIYATAWLPVQSPTGSIMPLQRLVAWNARTGAVRLAIDPSPSQGTSFDTAPDLMGVGVSPDGALLISARLAYRGNTPDWAVTFWSTADGALVRETPFPYSEVSLFDGAISGDGHWAIETSAPGDPDESKQVVVGDASGAILYARRANVHGTLAFSPDGSRLMLTPPIEPGLPGLIVYDVATGDEVASRSFGSDPL